DFGLHGVEMLWLSRVKLNLRPAGGEEVAFHESRLSLANDEPAAPDASEGGLWRGLAEGASNIAGGRFGCRRGEDRGLGQWHPILHRDGRGVAECPHMLNAGAEGVSISREPTLLDHAGFGQDRRCGV